MRPCHALVKTSMRWTSKRSAWEYDLDVFNIAAVSDFNMGAMENKGLNVFNTKYVLAKPGHRDRRRLPGHRVGDRARIFPQLDRRPGDLPRLVQLSLKEGLTVYRDQEFSADQGSRAVKRIGDVRALRAAQFREDGGPLAHPVQPKSYLAIDNFYTATVYNKGAEVIRMMATIIGRDAFRKGMDLYFQRHDNNAVTIEDFVAAMADASGVDLDKFRAWYDQAGTPEVTVDDNYDAALKQYPLTIRQTTARPRGSPTSSPWSFRWRWDCSTAMARNWIPNSRVRRPRDQARACCSPTRPKQRLPLRTWPARRCPRCFAAFPRR